MMIMLQDKYNIKSSINVSRKGTNQNIITFLSFFNAFYNGIRMHRKPNFYHDMCDPYGFALMCKDYNGLDIKYDSSMTCKQIFEGNALDDNFSTDYPTYKGQFTFKEILDFLYTGFLFDYEKAMNVYQNQYDAFDIFNQILNGDGFIFNRAKPTLKKTQQALKTAFESIITLNENKTIRPPHVWRLCDGMIAPFIVQKYYPDMKIEKADCHGFGEGIFITSNNEIIDCLKINDTWFTDLPLESRLQFAFKCTDFDVAQYGKAWSWRSILDVGKMLDANSTNGLLVRGARENFFKNRWFNWSKTSLVYCKKVNGELVAKAPGRASPTFYTLEGDEGLINLLEERRYERIYLDEWDIREFKKILELGD